MQEGLSMKQGTSESEDNNFEEEMRCAFWRGVSLLDETQPYEGQRREKAAPSGPSSQREVFSEIPKNVVALKSVIGKITEKNPPKGVSDSWRLAVKDALRVLKGNDIRKRSRLEILLRDLKDEMGLVDVLYQEHGRQ